MGLGRVVFEVEQNKVRCAGGLPKVRPGHIAGGFHSRMRTFCFEQLDHCGDKRGLQRRFAARNRDPAPGNLVQQLVAQQLLREFRSSDLSPDQGQRA